ncbi:MAG TPA: Fe2+-dependent dioxygenase [Sphingomonas sp.]|nr:Fe2+-dependent dioxygenase [Sphingomonas sp.]
MFKRIDGVLSPVALAELRRIAAAGPYLDGRVSNPHNTAKKNAILGDQQGRAASAKIMAEALLAHEDFRNFAFPKVVAPPLITTYRKDMSYGLHADAAFMPIGQRPLRSDLSCTIFLSELDSYDGGALRIVLGDTEVSIRYPAGSAIVYPSNTMHEVTPVTRGERLVGLTFIESRVADPQQREWLYELNEVAALEGLGMRPENYGRLQRVQANLLRLWGDAG